MGLAVGVAVLAVSLLGPTPEHAAAVAPPVTQCNAEANAGGQGIRCTVTIVNYATNAGLINLATPSTVTLTRCVGAAGPVAAGAGTCTTVTTTSTEPVTQVQQCNGSGSGGGGVVICSVTVTNTFLTGPDVLPTSARIYQCVGSVIAGPGAPGTCTPANTPGVTTVAAATVGQCNGSGNGGTSVEFTCTTAGASTTTSSLAVNIDQCNGSANGGGALTRCTATVTNVTAPAPPLPPEPAAEPAPVAVVVPTPVVVVTVPIATPTPVVAVVVPTPSPVLVPVPAPSPGVPVQTPPTVTTIRPPATGNAGLLDRNGSAVGWAWVLVVGALALMFGGRVVTSLRRR